MFDLGAGRGAVYIFSLRGTRLAGKGARYIDRFYRSKAFFWSAALLLVQGFSAGGKGES